MTSPAILAELRDKRRSCNDPNCKCKRVDWLTEAIRNEFDYRMRKAGKRK